MVLAGRVTIATSPVVALFPLLIPASKLLSATGERCPFQDLLMGFKRRN
jgi:hypothetical protein